MIQLEFIVKEKTLHMCKIVQVYAVVYRQTSQFPA